VPLPSLPSLVPPINNLASPFPSQFHSNTHRTRSRSQSSSLGYPALPPPFTACLCDGEGIGVVEAEGGGGRRGGRRGVRGGGRRARADHLLPWQPPGTVRLRLPPPPATPLPAPARRRRQLLPQPRHPPREQVRYCSSTCHLVCSITFRFDAIDAKSIAFGVLSKLAAAMASKGRDGLLAGWRSISSPAQRRGMTLCPGSRGYP
jgi:hypothetical protein